MKVQTAINMLRLLYPEECVIMAWWRKDMFSDDITKEEWEECHDAGEDICWSDTHDTIAWAIDQAIEETKEESNEFATEN